MLGFKTSNAVCGACRVAIEDRPSLLISPGDSEWIEPQVSPVPFRKAREGAAGEPITEGFGEGGPPTEGFGFLRPGGEG